MVDFETDRLISLRKLDDINGNVLVSFPDEVREKGQHTIYWDGLDAQSHEIPPGIYFISLKCSDKAFTQKIINY
ncbi:MAG: hypothetical protein U5Q03_15965 [Bacteroidota bacterium]|nr:hypothetical protein [Bacteroidota bacterium]